MKLKLFLLFVVTFCCSVTFAQKSNSRMFSLNKKVVFKTNGAGADKMRDMLIDFFGEAKVKVGTRGRKIKDTIFITEYPETRKGADCSVDIYKHSVEIRYKGDANRQKALNTLIAKYNKITGNKNVPRNTLIDNKDYDKEVDLTSESMNIRELHENIDWVLANGFKEMNIKIYSSEGIAITSPNYAIFNPKESLSKVEMCSAKELYDLLKEHEKRVKFNFIVDFSGDERSFFKEVMGYEALSDEGVRVIRQFVKELELLASIGTFDILYDENDLKLKCYIEPLFVDFDLNKTKISVMNSVKTK